MNPDAGPGAESAGGSPYSPTSSALDTAAIIVNYRTMRLTRAAVSSVLAEADTREVVVVDNASGDGSADYLATTIADERVRIVECDRNRGFGQAANIGVANSRSPLILVVNSDATLVSGSLRRLADTLLADDGVGVVAPAVYCADGMSLQAGAYGRLPRRREIVFGDWSMKARADTPSDGAEPEWVSGVAMLLRRSDFAAVGGFDESFEMYFEDLDLCRRLRERGKSVRRQPLAGVVHMGGRSWQSRTDQVQCFHVSKLRYFEKLGATKFDLCCVRLLGLVRTALAWRPGPVALRSFPRSPRPAGGAHQLVREEPRPLPGQRIPDDAP